MSGSAGIGVAPGSSTYASNTLHVGDGTWDSNRDTFLLPNLMGLNFETMRYNGMGNRFAGDENYHKIILGHGVLAAMVFLFIVPAAIFIPRFYWRNPLYAMKFHIWLQIMTVLLSTVILVLGWFAVGPNRSLSNPHHGIGIAIYVLILFQAMYGWLVRKVEKGRQIPKISIKLMIHQWVGRATALLAITQVALGLALYGSPKIMFILYALWIFALLVAWFIFSHRYQGGDDLSSTYYSSGGRTDVSGDSESGHKGRKILGVLAAGGIAAAVLNRFRKKKEDGSEHGHGGAHSHHSHHDSAYSGTGSSWSQDEKQHRPKDHTWRDRLLAGAGIAAAAGLASKWFGKKEQKHEHDSVSNASYSQASHPYTASRTDVSRMEEGRAPMTPTQQRIHRTDETTIPVAAASPSRHSRLHGRGRAGGSIYSDETHSHYASPGRDKQKSHTFRNSIAAMGVGAFLMNKFRRSSRQKEDTRVEEIRRRDEEEERRQRMDGGRRFTGDGRIRRTSSYSDSDFTSHPGTTPGHSRHHLDRPGAVLAGAAVGAAAASGLRPGSRTRIDESIHSTSQHNLPPPPPLGRVHHDSSGSESFMTNGGHRGHRHHNSAGLPLAAGMAAGAAAADARRRRSSVGSPPLSLKMHTTDTNGRQRVTLRRLSPAEAAAEREAARRRERQGGRSNSASSIGGGMSDNERWRRTEAREQAQANEMASLGVANDSRHNISAASIPPPPPILHSSSPPYDLPPPPPIPGTGSAAYDTGGSAAGSRADSNRRRRRAERARAEQARQEGRGNRVDFT